MTREEFNAAVMQAYNEFETKELAKTPQQIYCDAYDIAKTVALKDYLTESDDENIEQLFHRAITILDELYQYEWDYDEPMWCKWDDISSMIDDFLEEKGASNGYFDSADGKWHCKYVDRNAGGYLYDGFDNIAIEEKENTNE